MNTHVVVATQTFKQSTIVLLIFVYGLDN